MKKNDDKKMYVLLSILGVVATGVLIYGVNTTYNKQTAATQDIGVVTNEVKKDEYVRVSLDKLLNPGELDIYTNNEKTSAKSVSGQTNVKYKIVTDKSVQIPTDIKNGLIDYINKATKTFEPYNNMLLIEFADIDIPNRFGYISLVIPSGYVTESGVEGTNKDIVYQFKNGQYKFVEKDNQEFVAFVSQLPNTLKGNSIKDNFIAKKPILAKGQSAVSSMPSLKFPWAEKKKARMNRNRLHEYSSFDSKNTAIDWGLEDLEVLSPFNGKVKKYCNLAGDSTNISLVMSVDGINQEFIIMHLKKSSITSVVKNNGVVKQGQKLGTIKTGAFGDNCGVSTGTHMHFGFQSIPYTMDGFEFLKDGFKNRSGKKYSYTSTDWHFVSTNKKVN